MQIGLNLYDLGLTAVRAPRMDKEEISIDSGLLSRPVAYLDFDLDDNVESILPLAQLLAKAPDLAEALDHLLTWHKLTNPGAYGPAVRKAEALLAALPQRAPMPAEAA